MAAVVGARELRAPGVHVEVEHRRPAPALETGVPAFLGALAMTAKDGDAPPPAEDARVVALDEQAWASLERSHGGPGWAAGRLGHAVRGFFENGGRRCYLALLPRRDYARRGVDLADVGRALDALEAVHDFDLICAPDAAPQLSKTQFPALPPGARGLLVDRCAKRDGCFAILDGIGDEYPTNAIDRAMLEADKGELAALLGDHRTAAAVYGPWIKVRDACPSCAGARCGSCAGTGQGFVPPSGHLAGVYARTDRRIGPHKAPANEVLEGPLGLQVYLDEAALGALSGAGFNAIRALPGRGVRVWGARTLAPEDPSFGLVNTRRLFQTVARWLEQAMADVAFEPNDLRLWARVGREVGSYLEDLHRRGALAGASPEEAFSVQCDAETNPPDVRERGEVVAEVGLALARPAEFIIVRLVASADGARAVL